MKKLHENQIKDVKLKKKIKCDKLTNHPTTKEDELKAALKQQLRR
jgi:hypothetical protein